MKKILSLLSLTIMIAIVFNSCKKDEDEGLLPAISFKTGSQYTSASTVVEKNKPVLIGINANKTEDKDVLTKFTVKVSYDGGADSTIYTEDLSGAKGDNYSHDQSVTTRSQAGTEKYTFTVINRDGLVNNVNLTLTVQ